MIFVTVDWVKCETVAKRCGVKPRTVRNWIKRKRILGTVIDGRYYVSAIAYDALKRKLDNEL